MIKKNIICRLKKFLFNKNRPKMVWEYINPNGVTSKNTRISNTTAFYKEEKIQIDTNVYIGHYCVLDGTGGIHIEEGCQIAGWNGIYTHSSHIAIRLYGKHYHECPEENKKGYNVGQVKIGKYSFIGVGVKIFSGVQVGKGALIKAGTVITKDVKDFEIIAGSPAKVVGDTRKLDEKYLLENPELTVWYKEWQ